LLPTGDCRVAAWFRYARFAYYSTGAPLLYFFIIARNEEKSIIPQLSSDITSDKAYKPASSAYKINRAFEMSQLVSEGESPIGITIHRSGNIHGWLLPRPGPGPLPE
jgi:hypothetical protein